LVRVLVVDVDVLDVLDVVLVRFDVVVDVVVTSFW
jgi:hypothetical protein